MSASVNNRGEQVEKPSIGQFFQTFFRANYLYRVVWRWHFYMGLFITPVLIIVAITGSLYVFREEIEPFAYGNLLFVNKVTPSQINPSEAVKAAEDAYPTHHAEGLIVDRNMEKAWAVSMHHDVDDRHVTVYVDQYSGEVLGEQAYDEGFFGTVLKIHRQLFVGAFGRILVELSTAWGIVSVLTGIFLWWPRGRDKVWGVWTMRLRKSRKLFWRDLHSIPAIYGAFFVLLIMFTGLLFSFTGRYTFFGTGALLGQLPEVYLNPPQSTLVEGGEPVGIDTAVSHFKQTIKLSHFNLSLPAAADGAYAFNVNLDHDFANAHLLYIDQYSGKTVAAVRWQQLSLYTKGLLFFYPIHTGGIFGLPTKILAFLACWVVVLMGISGVVMWWQRKPAGEILGAPRQPKTAVVPRIVTILSIVLGLMLPMVGLTLLFVLLSSWLFSFYQRKTTLSLAKD